MVNLRMEMNMKRVNSHYIYDQNEDDDEESQYNDNIYGQNEDIDGYFNTVNENVEQGI